MIPLETDRQGAGRGLLEWAFARRVSESLFFLPPVLFVRSVASGLSEVHPPLHRNELERGCGVLV